MGLDKGPEKKKERSHNTTTSTSTKTTNTIAASTDTTKSVTGTSGLSNSLKMRLMVLGKEMMLQRPSIVKKQRCQRRRKLGEEEQAAFSLMALSCGSVFA